MLRFSNFDVTPLPVACFPGYGPGRFSGPCRRATGRGRVPGAGAGPGSRGRGRGRGPAAKVSTLVGLAPSNHGTSVDGLTTLAQDLGLGGVFDVILGSSCEACVEQEAGSAFLAQLNSGGDAVPGVTYTVIESRDDEVVTPYSSAFLAGPAVTNITVQNQCPLDQSDHLEIAYDPVAMADMLNALDPARPVRVPCVPVLPITGPIGPVPSF